MDNIPRSSSLHAYLVIHNLPKLNLDGAGFDETGEFIKCEDQGLVTLSFGVHAALASFGGYF